MTISVRLLAHASVQIHSESKNIYIDPTTKGTGLKRKDFEPADLILVTHGHQDHFDKDLIKKIRKMGSPVIAPEVLKDELKGSIVWGMSSGERMEISNGVVVWAVPAYNINRFRESGEPFHPREIGLGYVIKVDEKKIYHAGDTDLIPEMEEFPEIDVALLPSGGTYTMDMEEAARAAILIKPKVAVPMHLRGADPQAFKDNVENKSPTKVITLEKGEEFKIEW